MMNPLDNLIARGQQDEAGPNVSVINASEAEFMIEGLQKYQVEGIGSAEYMRQHEWIEKLNLQAHINAQTHSDEFVMAGLASHDKIAVLIHDLLVIEAWKERVYPYLKRHLAEKVDSVTAYLLLYHEAAIANLLEISLYHISACESTGEDSLIELADWCYRYATSGQRFASKQVDRLPAVSSITAITLHNFHVLIYSCFTLPA